MVRFCECDDCGVDMELDTMDNVCVCPDCLKNEEEKIILEMER